MVYDSNGFNYQGESIVDMFDNTYPGGNTSGFQKNGADIGTLVTCVGSYSGRQAFRDTTLNLGYTTVISNNVVDIDEIFCTERPIPTITVKKYADGSGPGSKNYEVKYEASHTDDTGVSRTRLQFYAQIPNNFGSENGSNVAQSWSQYTLNVSDVGATCAVRVIVCAGGGAGGERPDGGYNAGPGGGGGGEVKFIGGHLLQAGTYTIQVGSGGKWTTNGTDSFISGPSIPNGSLIAKGGGAGGGGPYHNDGIGGGHQLNGRDGGSGGGGMNGWTGGDYVSGSDGGLTNVISYGNHGGTGKNDQGGAGGGGASDHVFNLGDGVNATGYSGASGGEWEVIDNLKLGGGGSGRSSYGDGFANHGTDYGGNTGGNVVYGGGGRGDENSTECGIVTLAYRLDTAVLANGTANYTVLGMPLSTLYLTDLDP